MATRYAQDQFGTLAMSAMTPIPAVQVNRKSKCMQTEPLKGGGHGY